MRIVFSVPGEPVAKARPKFARAGKFVKTYTPKKSLNFEQAIAFYAQREMEEKGVQMIQDEPVVLSVIAYFNRPKSRRRRRNRGIETPRIVKPDFDNLLKAVADGLNGVAFRDDALVYKATLEKLEIDDMPRTSIVVETMKIG